MEEKESKFNNINDNKISILKKITDFSEYIFKKIDEKSGFFYLIIAIICFLIFIISLVYFFTKVKFDKKTQTYLTKSDGKVYELKLENDIQYMNDFISDTKDIPFERENKLSSLVFTELSTFEETKNFKFNVYIPKINILLNKKVDDIEEIKQKIIDVNERVNIIRTVFEGNNKLNFKYYAYYYQNALSFGYSYYEDFQNNIIDERRSFVLDANTNQIMTYEEYLKSREIDEKKLSIAIKEIIRREKLKYKYNKKTKDYYINEKGSINLIIDNNKRIEINIK